MIEPRRTMSRIRPRRQAFTLSELLIALAIILLLVSILVPAVGRARDETKLTLCRTHLRNVGIGLAMYADEHESKLPLAETVSNPRPKLLAALGKPYVEDAGNFYCPSETKPELVYSRQNVAAGNIGLFYYACRRAATDRNISGYLRFDVDWPRELRTSLDPATWVMSDSWFRDERTPHWYYRKGVNYLRLDWAVEMVEASPRKSFK